MWSPFDGVNFIDKRTNTIQYTPLFRLFKRFCRDFRFFLAKAFPQEKGTGRAGRACKKRTAAVYYRKLIRRNAKTELKPAP
jgi:hypothetical protein